MENIPVNPTPPAAGWTPTKATVTGGLVGGASAQVLTFLLGYFGIQLDAATAAALATLLGTLITYLHPANAGRS